MKRLNITLPDELVKALHNYKNMSLFIAEALKEKIERVRREKIKELLKEGYINTREEDIKINKEWEAATLEGWDEL